MVWGASEDLTPGSRVDTLRSRRRVALKQRLYDEYRIEVPLPVWRDQPAVRVSVQGYNTRADLERLMAALGTLLAVGT